MNGERDGIEKFVKRKKNFYPSRDLCFTVYFSLYQNLRFLSLGSLMHAPPSHVPVFNFINSIPYIDRFKSVRLLSFLSPDGTIKHAPTFA